MKNLKVNGVKFSDTVVGDATHSGWSSIAPFFEAAAVPRRRVSAPMAKALLDANTFQKKKVELSVEQIEVNAQFLNIWVGDELLLGTMVDERSSKITGYVSPSAAATGEITLEFADGTRTKFSAPVDAE